MVFLPDLSDGETSDGGGGTSPSGVLNFDDELMTSTPNINNRDSSNCNTLETMSARSFGFIKPSQKVRDNDMASRLRRHKSFFNADTSSASVLGMSFSDWVTILDLVGKVEGLEFEPWTF